MNFAKRVYLLAGIYGLLVLAPDYFLMARIGRDYPPAITHAEYFYGFVGTALVWQLVFLVIARDPVRYRPLMAVSVLEKLAFGLPVWILHLQGRLAGPVLVFGTIDLVLGALFLTSYLRTPART